jgi:DNA replication protein DnaC
MSTIGEIQELARELHIKSLQTKKFGIFEDEKSNTEFLLDCLKEEAKFRQERATALRIKQACLPAEKKFDVFRYPGSKRHHEQTIEATRGA